ncbi:MAG: YetF domain-containing protein [Parvularcula sp.]|jgi:uncharacterized membrane protein YcaP (DUF421 family)|nr:YetF domain-containing protein [Parvularcula sp.]
MTEKDAVWFYDLQGVWEVILAAPLIYFLVILFVRISGKRTTGQMNNFDWIVTVAMGSVVASGLVINTVEIVEAATAVLMLIGLQYILTKLAGRVNVVDRAVKSQPRLLISRGAINEKALKAERLTEDELAAALREHGVARLADIQWLLLENTGRFSVLTRDGVEGGIDEFVMTGEIKRDVRLSR